MHPSPFPALGPGLTCLNSVVPTDKLDLGTPTGAADGGQFCRPLSPLPQAPHLPGLSMKLLPKGLPPPLGAGQGPWYQKTQRPLGNHHPLGSMTKAGLRLRLSSGTGALSATLPLSYLLLEKARPAQPQQPSASLARRKWSGAQCPLTPIRPQSLLCDQLH